MVNIHKGCVRGIKRYLQLEYKDILSVITWTRLKLCIGLCSTDIMSHKVYLIGFELRCILLAVNIWPKLFI